MELLLALLSQPDAYLPQVLTVPNAFDEAPMLEPIDQPHSTVVSDQQSVGEHPHSGAVGFGQGLDRQQELVLLGLESLFPGGVVAEVKKPADLIAKSPQRLVVFGSELGFS